MAKYSTGDAIKTEKNKTATELFKFINENFMNRNEVLGFRGHSDSSWMLETTFDRYYKSLNEPFSKKVVLNSLTQSFKDNLVMNNDLPQSVVETMDITMYGQHFGLPTPLIDWSKSPYVALFFALIDAEATEKRCLWVLDLSLLDYFNEIVREKIRPANSSRFGNDQNTLEEEYPTLDVISHISEHNKRIAMQQGFFTQHLYFDSIETWIDIIDREIPHDYGVLITKHEFSCSEAERLLLLDKLDAMNINHRTLFPDIHGSVQGAIDSTTREQRMPKRKERAGVLKKKI